MMVQLRNKSQYKVEVLKASAIELIGDVSKLDGRPVRVTLRRDREETLCDCPCGHIDDEGFLCGRAMALIVHVRETAAAPVNLMWDHFGREFISPQISTLAWQLCYPIDPKFPSA